MVGIPKARYAVWREEIRAWWREYFRDAFGQVDDIEELVDARMVDHEIIVDEEEEDLINLL